MAKLKVAVLVSGGGTNLQALIDACKNKDYPAEIVLVLSNKENAYAIQRAKDASIATKFISHKDFSSREEFDKAMHKEIVKSGAQLVCMAGFMRLLSPWFVDQWYDKLINIHPSLLPDFKGLNAQEQALKAGAKEAGCTVHFVRPAMDEGPIIAQEVVPVLENDTAEDLSKRILEKEHICYVKALKLVALGNYEIKDEIFLLNTI